MTQRRGADDAHGTEMAEAAATPAADGEEADAEAVAFVRRHTRPGRAALVPELQLYLAEAVVPLWEATERWAAGPQPPPFWAFAWPGSQVLARWVLDQPALVQHQRVLDLGAGSGLAALAALRAGARAVVANDLDPLAGTVQRLNAALNGLAVCRSPALRPPTGDAGSLTDDTGSATDDAGWLTGDADGLWIVCADLVGTMRAGLGVDVVLAGDVCYDRQQAPRITAWLRRLAAAGADVLLADPGRTYAPLDGFEVLATFEVPTLPDLESAPSRTTRLLHLHG